MPHNGDEQLSSDDLVHKAREGLERPAGEIPSVDDRSAGSDQEDGSLPSPNEEETSPSSSDSSSEEGRAAKTDEFDFRNTDRTPAPGRISAADVVTAVGQIVRAVLFVMSVFAVVGGLLLLFDEDPTNNTQGIFMVLIFALMVFVTGGSFWAVAKHKKPRQDLWSLPGEDSSFATLEHDELGLAGQIVSSDELVEESARIVPTRRQWVLAPFGSVATLKQAELTFDGLASARISTTFNVDHRFIDADFLRETRVDFGEGRPAWRIREVAPEDRSEQAQQSELPQISAKDRRVVVESVPPGGGPSIDRLAETVTAFGRQCVIRAGGEDYVLTPASKASSGWITKHGRIERTGFWWSTSWRAEIKQPTPLSVVLAYWHLLIGDIQHANSGVGPGGG